MTAIYKREMRSYFTSPVGYIFVAVFTVLSAYFFTDYTLQAGEDSSFASYFAILLYIFIAIIPLITMKLISEERKIRTEQLILTGPVSLFGIVFAKFLAAFTLFGGTFSLTSAVFYIPLSMYGAPNGMKYLCNYLAVLLAGAAFIAIGVFISSLTENQFIAAIGTMAVILLLLFINSLNNYINVAFIRNIFSALSFSSRFANFANGIFDYSSLFYFLSMSGLFLFLTVRSFEKRRWS